MNISSGIKIFSKIDILDRITLSSGVTNDFLSYKELYNENAFIPRGPWKSLNENEKNKLIAPQISPTDYSNNISIIQLPDAVIVELLKYFEKISPSEKNIDFFDDNNFLFYTENLSNYIEKNYLIIADQFEFSGFSMKDAGHLATSTYHTQQNMHTGIHLDNGSCATLYERKNAPNRICINLGKEARSFLFINLTVVQIFEMCNLDDPLKVNILIKDPTLLNAYFFDKFPNYPVVKIMVKPGEAYIAPTENIFHDGSTFGNITTDIFLTFHGFFKLL